MKNHIAVNVETEFKPSDISGNHNKLAKTNQNNLNQHLTKGIFFENINKQTNKCVIKEDPRFLKFISVTYLFVIYEYWKLTYISNFDFFIWENVFRQSHNIRNNSLLMTVITNVHVNTLIYFLMYLGNIWEIHCNRPVQYPQIASTIAETWLFM